MVSDVSIIFRFYPFEKNPSFPSHIRFTNTSSIPPREIVDEIMVFEDRREIDMNYIKIDHSTSYNYGTKLFDVDALITKPYFFHTAIIVYKDVLISAGYSPFYKGILYFKPKTQFISGVYMKSQGCGVSYYADEIIAFGHSEIKVIGHWFFDVLIPLMLLPADVLHRAKILIRHDIQFMHESLEYLGIDKENIVMILNEDWCFAHHAYCLYPSPHISMFGEPMLKLRKILLKRLGLENVVPSIAYVANRKRFRRFSENFMMAAFDYFKRYYGKYNWQLNDDKYTTIIDIAKMWTSALFVFAPTGSNLIGSLFMHKGGVLLVANADANDHAFQYISATFEIFFLAFSCIGSYHWEEEPLKIDISILRRLAPIAFFALEEQAWKSDVDLDPIK